MEYFDIPNIPINKLFMISINVHYNMVEVYLNGKLRYIFNLQGISDFKSKSNLYVKQTPSYLGSVYNLTYLPVFVKHSKIQMFYKEKPKINNK